MQHATAPYLVLQTMQDVLRENIPIQFIRSGYIFFETLTHYEDEESALKYRAWHSDVSIQEGEHLCEPWRYPVVTSSDDGSDAEN